MQVLSPTSPLDLHGLSHFTYPSLIQEERSELTQIPQDAQALLKKKESKQNALSISQTVTKSASSQDSLFFTVKGQKLVCPNEVILNILSFCDFWDGQTASLTCHRFSQIWETPEIWQRLRIRNFPALNQKDESLIDFSPFSEKSYYRRQLELLRSNTDQSIKDIRTNLCSFFPENKGILPHPISYYFALDEQGNIRAISCQNKAMKLKNAKEKLRLQDEDWKVKASVSIAFIHIAMVDGNYPIKPKIEFEIIQQVTGCQKEKINLLQNRINLWIKQTSQSPDLDQRVAKVLENHSTHTTQIRSQRNGVITSKIKAYLLFFREQVSFCRFTSSPGILIEKEQITSPTSNS